MKRAEAKAKVTSDANSNPVLDTLTNAYLDLEEALELRYWIPGEVVLEGEHAGIISYAKVEGERGLFYTHEAASATRQRLFTCSVSIRVAASSVLANLVEVLRRRQAETTSHVGEAALRIQCLTDEVRGGIRPVRDTEPIVETYKRRGFPYSEQNE